jgi:divalent metal cation (Fe/Co/Zn/Cd) transporter
VSPGTDTFRYRGVAEHRTDVLVESALVLGNIIVAVWLVDRHIPAYWHLDRALSLTISFVIVQTVLIAVLLTTMFGL